MALRTYVVALRTEASLAGAPALGTVVAESFRAAQERAEERWPDHARVVRAAGGVSTDILIRALTADAAGASVGRVAEKRANGGRL